MTAPHDGGYRFDLDSEVTRTPVRYLNRYGIEIAADLYLPKGLDRSAKHPAVVIGPPHSAVKEQAPGVYANQLAKRGLVALAFDPSFNGESGGEARRVTSPEIFAEDFSAGVDFLGTLPHVDRERIGALGVCGSGGFALSAAQIDTRIKAVVTSAMYDISGVKREGWEHAATDEQRRATLAALSEQRWKDVDAGVPKVVRAFPAEPADQVPEGLNPGAAEFFEYYGTERGHHPRAIGGFTTTSDAAHINFGSLRSLDDLAPRPILLVTGGNAHSRYFSEDVHTQAPGPSELLVVPGARHIDLYDRIDLIPFDAIAALYAESLI
ncbi:alpha/beta hydrolase [Arthrobacter sp. StoSoilB20]|uniref:alpha/beta hydrolase n=1 Tax=Arthrobacter sp. StoSoilB20 TaxID=2830995 RepID=UPI001CC4F691|nr:alpha/beta hydrolase [Arthrobacter sp. StoSoilB20]BCW58617.1 alpha/beta hydrolase [Arthrobacter sp. StoSoilB20]